MNGTSCQAWRQEGDRGCSGSGWGSGDDKVVNEDIVEWGLVLRDVAGDEEIGFEVKVRYHALGGTFGDAEGIRDPPTFPLRIQ
jgi:hypothetical protein